MAINNNDLEYIGGDGLGLFAYWLGLARNQG